MVSMAGVVVQAHSLAEAAEVVPAKAEVHSDEDQEGEAAPAKPHEKPLLKSPASPTTPNATTAEKAEKQAQQGKQSKLTLNQDAGARNAMPILKSFQDATTRHNHLIMCNVKSRGPAVPLSKTSSCVML